MDILKKASITPEAIYSDLMAYIRNKGESAWTDFATAGGGEAVLGAMSALGGLLNFNLLLVERELHVSTMTRYDSGVMLCNMHGYPVGRKSSPIIKLRLNVSQDNLIQKGKVLGYMAGYPLVTVTAEFFKAGEEREIYLTFGVWESKHEWEITRTEKFYSYYIEEANNALEDTLEAPIEGEEWKLVNLTVGGVDVRLVRSVDELDAKSVICMTVVGGVLLIFGDGKLGRIAEVAQGTKANIAFEYLKSTGYIDFSEVKSDSFIWDLGGKVEILPLFEGGKSGFINGFVDDTDENKRGNIVRYGTEEDSLRKLKALAPVYFAAKRRMVTARDFEAVLGGYRGIEGVCYAGRQNPFKYVPFELDGEGNRVYTDEAIVKYSEEKNKVYFSYIYKGTSDYSTPENTALISKIDLDKFCEDKLVLGTYLDIRPAKPVFVNIRIGLVVSANFSRTIKELEEEIKEKLEALTLRIGEGFYIGHIDTILRDVVGVERHYIYSPLRDCKGTDWREYVKLGKVYTEGGKLKVREGAIELVQVTTSKEKYFVPEDPQEKDYDTGYYKFVEIPVKRREIKEVGGVFEVVEGEGEINSGYRSGFWSYERDDTGFEEANWRARPERKDFVIVEGEGGNEIVSLDEEAYQEALKDYKEVVYGG